MGWSILRRATDEDEDRMAAAVRRFVARYGFHPDWDDQEHTPRTRRAWVKATRRALRCSSCDGISWGYVGWHVD